jgi:hypothetical protein
VQVPDPAPHEGQPILVIDPDHPDELLGILTPFDLL